MDPPPPPPPFPPPKKTKKKKKKKTTTTTPKQTNNNNKIKNNDGLSCQTAGLPSNNADGICLRLRCTYRLVLGINDSIAVSKMCPLPLSFSATGEDPVPTSQRQNLEVNSLQALEVQLRQQKPSFSHKTDKNKRNQITTITIISV